MLVSALRPWGAQRTGANVRATRHGLWALVITGTISLAGTTEALPTKAQVCEAAKVTASGTMQKCLATQRAKEVKGGIPNYAACDTRFINAFEAAEDRAGGACPTEADAPDIKGLIDACFDDLKSALSASPNPPCVPGVFPATG